MVSKEPRQRSMEKACDNAIRTTLSYSAVFNYPLSRYQLFTYLNSRRVFSDEIFDKSLRRLVKNGGVKARDGKYFLPGIRPVSWGLRYKYSKELLEEGYSSVALLKKIPWIKMLAVTGAVAAQNAGKDDDIDIFIITQKNRVWLTRFFVFLLLKIVGRYAHNSDNQKKLCCNLYVDESKFKWAENKRNFYIAYEIINMLPLIDRDDTYFRFIKANDWALTYFKNFKITLPEKNIKIESGSILMNRLEDFIRKMQLSYMKGKITTEVTTKNLIHFNKNDHSEKILSAYKENLERLM